MVWVFCMVGRLRGRRNERYDCFCFVFVEVGGGRGGGWVGLLLLS